MAHYHSEENPGPNNYVGWMSGPPGEDNIFPMTSRKLLTAVEIPNTKVISRMFAETALDVSGNPLRQSYSDNDESRDTRYSGYQHPLVNPIIEVQQNRSPSNHGILTIGDSLLDILRKEIGMSPVSPGNPLYEQKKRFFATLSQKNKKPAFFSGFNQEFKNSNWLNIGSGYDSSYYGVIAIMNRDNLLKFNSRLGYFLDYHSQETSVNIYEEPEFGRLDRLNNNEIYNPEALSYDFLRACYLNFKIFNIKINRKRVSNSMTSNNPFGTPCYENYDKNQIEETIFLSDSSLGRENPLSFLENTLRDKAAIEVREIAVGS